MTPIAKALALAGGILLIPAAAAQAAVTASYDGTTVTIAGTAADEALDISAYDGPLTLPGAVAGPGCTADEWGPTPFDSIDQRLDSPR